MHQPIIRLRLHISLAAVLLFLIAVANVGLAQQTPVDTASETVENVETITADSDASDGPANPARKVEVDPVASDGQIARRLKRILNASKWVTNANVTVDEGIVFLEGRAKEDEYSEWAANVARNTQDVVAVVNNIEVNDRVDISESVAHVGESLATLWRDFLRRLPLVLAGCLVLIMTWIAAAFATTVVRRTARRSRLRDSLRDLMVQLTTFFVWLAGIMIAAIVIFPGMTPAKLLTVLGLSSVAIGFAFKDIFENFFAGVLILWRFPFDPGDYIECGEIEGKVEDITIRMSKIRQVDGQLVVVPNAMLFKQPVHVLTNSKTRRTTVICGVAYDEDIDQCRDVIQRAVSGCKTVARQKPVEIFAQEFASSSINFEVTWWAGSTPVEIRQSRDEVVAAVKRALDDAGIEIPFPYRTLTFKEPLHTVSNEQQNHSVA